LNISPIYRNVQGGNSQQPAATVGEHAVSSNDDAQRESDSAHGGTSETTS